MTQQALFIAILVILPLLAGTAAAQKCPLHLVQSMSDAGRKYNTFSVTLRNNGATAVQNIVLTTETDLKSVDDLTSTKSGYTLPESKMTIGAGDSFTFSYTKQRASVASWKITCSASSSPTDTPSSSSSSTTGTVKATGTVGATATPAKATSAPAAPAVVNGRICPAGTWWRPQPMTTWQWQLTGSIDQSKNVQMYDIDLFDNTAATISSLHSKGRVVICYFSTQYENWRPDASKFTAAVLGSNLDDWAGERYVDSRSTLVRSIMSARLDLAVSKGCDGVEPDNVDAYSAKTGFPLTSADGLSYNQFFATQAHARGLSVGLKNNLGQASALQPSFDWALNEQCSQYGECSSLKAFVNNNKAVFNTEYSGTASSFCPKMNTAKISSLKKSLSLSAAVQAQCCTYLAGGCVSAPYTCVSSPGKRDLEDENLSVVVDDASVVTNDASVVANDAPVELDDAHASSASVVGVSLVVMLVVVLVV